MLLKAVKSSNSIFCRTYSKNIFKKYKFSMLSTSSNQLIEQERQKDSTTMDNVVASKSKVQQQQEQSTKITKAQQKILKSQKAFKKKTSYIPGMVNMQILGTGANGAPAAVYLFTDQSRYLFNCGEGTQRLAHEHKTKLSRLEQIFVTRNTWQTIGGFPGLALTVQDAGVKQLSIHGPPHLELVLHSMKRFVVLKALQVTTIDCTQVHDFEDTAMYVKCLPLYKSNLDKANDVNNNAVIAYLCKLKPRPGALNLEKCVEYGVKPGPLLGQLKNGEDVTLEDGTIVRSCDVSEPSETGLSFVFIDIPSEDYLSNLTAQARIFQNLNLNEEEKVSIVVHFTPENILQHKLYQNFMNNFEEHTKHVFLNSSRNNFSGFVAAHRIQYQLNQLHPNIFPLLAESNEFFDKSKTIIKKLKNDDNSVNEIRENLQHEAVVEMCNSLTNFHLRPKKGFDHSLEAKLNPKEYIDETELLTDFLALKEQFKLQLIKNNRNTKNKINEYPKITFLGTGSCIPNKTRNVSAILIQPKVNSYILLDCGEGTYGQLVRFFGNEKINEVMRNLKAIYISHLHADHHIGLIALLNERKRFFNNDGNLQKLLLFAPKQIESWLNFYDSSIEKITDTYELIGNSEMLAFPLKRTNTLSDIGIDNIKTCLVRHCPHSFGISFTVDKSPNSTNATHTTSDDLVKITYSGDTMPCQDLIEIGYNSTILIHEATMEDDLIDEAKIKMHSTISQAIQVGKEMKASHIILTHFSQRYAKLPRLENFGGITEAQALHNVAIAFDNMQVTLVDLPLFNLMYPSLRALFADHADELEQKALKRELKLERKRKILNEEG